MREPRGNRENRMQVERKERGKARKVSWRELKSELEGSRAAEIQNIDCGELEWMWRREKSGE